MSALLTPSQTTKIIDQDHARVGAWMQARGAGVYRQGTTCIGLERDGVLVAGTMYDFFNGASIYANIAIDGPINRQWLWFIFYYPFVQLNAKVLLGLVAQDNKKSQRLTEHLGFRLLASIPDADRSGDTLLYVMPKANCKWIRSRP
jgi:hypothetical protein